jgi:hypothetical protein
MLFLPKNATPVQLERKSLMRNGGIASDERKVTIWPDRGTQQARLGSSSMKVIASVRVSANEQSEKRSASQPKSRRSEWKRGVIGERTREALAYKRRNEKRVGTVPYGFALAEDGKHLVLVPAEMKMLAQMEMERARGTSYKRIADDLNADRIPTKGGGWWYAATVRSFLRTAQKPKGGPMQFTGPGRSSRPKAEAKLEVTEDMGPENLLAG